MKRRNQIKRLERRQSAFDKLKSELRSNGAWHRPGSVKKKSRG